MMRHSLSFFVVTFSLLTLISCSDQQIPTTTNKETPNPTASSQLKQTPAKSAAIGETVSLGKYKFTVNSVRDAVGDSISQPKQGKKYLIINATIENQGQKPSPISSIVLFTLTDSANQKYKRVITTEIKGNLDKNLDPGKKLQGEIAFEVPQDAKNLFLILRSDLVEPNLQAKVKLN
ncbi:MAG: DUF4352 domain-containing protein [Coleofasciculaceae cyanobacterium]|jgi:hypothetical protein